MEETGLISLKKTRKRNCREEFNQVNPRWRYARKIQTKLVKIISVILKGDSVDITGENNKHERFKFIIKDTRHRKVLSKLVAFAPNLTNNDPSQLEGLWIKGLFVPEDYKRYTQSRYVFVSIFTDRKPICPR